MNVDADQQIDRLINRHEASWREGYDAFPALLNKLGLKRGVEVGVAFGGHAGAILERGGVDKLFGVDRYRHQRGYDDPMNLAQPVFDRLANRVVDRMKPFENRFELVREESEEAGQRFKDHSLDFVYLDADHSEEGVWKDLRTWAIKVREGGVIAGHDFGHPDFPGVQRAVQRFFNRFGWTVHEEGHGVWWVQRQHLPITYFTPAYNCAQWIREASDSIIQGNLQPGDEYILVNDGSTDDTATLLDEIANTHDAVKVITHSENRGGSAARNTAVQSARHSLCFCLDSDNIILPGSVTNLRDHLFRSGSDTVGFQTLKYFKDVTGIEHITHAQTYEDVVTDLARFLQSTNVPSCSGNYLFTHEAWQRAGGYPSDAGAMDAWGFGLRKCATGSKITVLPGSFYYHRHAHDSYWTRDARAGKINRLALNVIRPFLDQIDPRDVRYIESRHGRDRWFSDLDRRPVRVRTPQTRTSPIATLEHTKLMGLFRKFVKAAS